jgi:hypothetical protein
LAALGHQQLHAGFPRIPDAPISAGVLAAVLSAVGGAAALRYWVVARETARAVRVRLTRARAIRSVAQLRRDRSAIYDALAELTAPAADGATPDETMLALAEEAP